MSNPIVLAAVSVLGLLLVVRAARWPLSVSIPIFMCGTALSLVNRLVVPITSSANLRVGVVTILALFGAYVLQRPWRSRVDLPLGSMSFLLVGLAMIVSTLFNSGYASEAKGLAKSILLMIYVLGYVWIIVTIGRDSRVLGGAVTWFILSMCLIALVHFVTFGYSILAHGMDVRRWLIGIRGFVFWEFAPESTYIDLYGPQDASLIGASAAMAITLTLHERDRGRGWLLGAALLQVVVMVFSLSRTAWLSFIVGMGLLIAYGLKQRALYPRAVAVGAAVAIGVLVLGSALASVRPRSGSAAAPGAASPGAPGAVSPGAPGAASPGAPGAVSPGAPGAVNRRTFGSIVNISEGTGRDRWNQYATMLKASLGGPILGRGAESHLLVTGSLPAENFILEIFYDAGWVGLITLLFGLTVVLWRGLRVVWRLSAARDGDEYLLPFAILVGTMVALASSMLTTTGWAPQFWVLLGLMVAASRVGR